MTPIVNGLEAEYGDRVAFVRLNAAGDGAAAFESLSLPGHPSFVVFDADGSEIGRAFGVVEAETLRGFIIEAPLSASLTPIAISHSAVI